MARFSALSLYIIELPSRRSLTSSADLRMLKCLETDGAEIVNISTISPARKSCSFKAVRICRRVGSASARKIIVGCFIISNLAY